MPLTTTNGSAILTPAEVGQLLVTPVQSAAVATNVSTVVTTASKTWRVPRVTADPAAAWVAEGAEITPDDPTVDEIEVTPAKVAGLSIVTRELADDSSPEAQQIVGEALARDIARRVDQAFFSSVADPAPDGLADLTGFTAVTTPAGETSWADLDVFAEAISEAEQLGAAVTAFVANPADVLALVQLKEAPSGSNRPLLQPDPTMPTRTSIQGIPLRSAPDVAPGTVWAIPEDRVHVVIRDDAEVTSDRSVFFTSDRIAVRATMRVGFGYPHPAAIVKITLAAA